MDGMWMALSKFQGRSELPKGHRPFGPATRKWRSKGLKRLNPDSERAGCLASPQGFTHLPLAFDDLAAASTNSRPLTPSSMVGKWADLSGFLPTRSRASMRSAR